MAEIKKIKVDGVEYDIGSNLGAELEWKLVASGEIVKEDNYKVKIENITIELKKQYILRILNAPYGVFDVFNLCFIEGGDCNYCNSIDENEEPTLVSCHYEEYIKELQLFSDGNGLIYGSGDEYELYELAIKNVVNPSNVGIGSEVQAELDKKQDKLTEGEGISILGNEISISSDVIRNVNEIFEFEHTPDEQKEIYLGQTVNTNFPIWLFIIRKIPHDNGDGTYWYSEESGEYYIYFTENKINLYSDSEGEDISATDFLDGCSFGGKPYVENAIWFADNNIITVEISYVAGVFSKNYDM